jgi:molybdopterin/thiamine biosynthesis adenylyltransferase
MKLRPEGGRYERQAALLGDCGQEKLDQARVFIAGAGGLGAAVSVYLAAAGTGRIEIADRDVVELSNLNRQILFSSGDVGRKKAGAAAERLRDLNPSVRLSVWTEDLLRPSLDERVSSFDVFVDALDDYGARYVLNRAALRLGIPLVHGAVRGFYGQVTTLVPGKTACLRCLFPRNPAVAQPPVIGSICGVVGCLQATEVIKLILGLGTLLENRLLFFDGLRGTWEEIEVGKRQDCPDCGGKGPPPEETRT